MVELVVEVGVLFQSREGSGKNLHDAEADGWGDGV